MQAILLGCLLCLQISNPCDPNQPNPFTQDPSCEKCLTDLRDHFNLPSDTNILSSNSIPPSQQSCEDRISSETTKILQNLLADTENIAEDINKNPHEVYDLVNRIGTEIRQEVQIPGNIRPAQDRSLETIQRQEELLAKITEKFRNLFHHTDDVLNKLSAMKELLKSEEVKEVKEVKEDDNDEEYVDEGRKRRDSIMPGERLMAGNYLESKNGEYKFLLSAKDGESYIYDRNGALKAHTVNCDFPKPTPPKLHMVMKDTLEYYLDIWHGKSANLRCSTIIPMECVSEHADCFVKLDNDGHFKYFTKAGEPVYTLL